MSIQITDQAVAELFKTHGTAKQVRRVLVKSGQGKHITDQEVIQALVRATGRIVKVSK